jgi:oligo-1,6-glucosidase
MSALREADPWWKNAVVYQVYPRSFADSDGDGIGDLGGVLAKLDYLADLGVDVIWLCPIYRSPHDDNGYDISDYRSVDPIFGDLATFDRLLAAAHGRGMKVILDVVVNHTSDEHPWFDSARSGKDDPYRDWYHWSAPAADGGPPNNWGSFFSGSAWTLDASSGEYYLHLFSEKQPDLNWENPAVRSAIHDMLRWWLDRGVDGFRMDVISFLSKRPGYPDAPAEDGASYGGTEFWWGSGPRIHEYLHELRQEVFAGREDVLLTVGETPGVSLEQAQAFTDPAANELDMVFQFEHVQLDQGATKWDLRPVPLVTLKRVLERWQTGIGSGWNSLYWNNHDQVRAVSRFGDDDEYRERSAKTLATVLHLHRGTPYVFQGEELGMTNAHFSDIGSYRDIESLRHYAEQIDGGADPHEVLRGLEAKSRDNSRTPMQWDDTENAGFTRGTPWIAVNANHRRINAQAQLADPDSVLAHYRKLIRLRHQEPILTHGDFTLLLPEHPELWAFTRTLGSEQLVVVANVSGAVVDIPALEELAGPPIEPVLGRLPVAARLDPWESFVARRVLTRENERESGDVATDVFA